MIEPTTILIATIITTIGLILLLVFRPSLTRMRSGKILAFIALFLFPVIAGIAGTSQHIESSKTTAFCLSCHVMDKYGASLHIDDRSYIPAVHYQNNFVPRDNACFTCHTNYTMYGDYKAKLRGLRHVYVQYFGKVPAPEDIKLYTPYNNRECLHCHAGARSFEEGATHNADPDTLPAIKAGKLSCVSTGCHETTHNVANIKDLPVWKEGSNEK